MTTERHSYGADPSQYGTLHRPRRGPRTQAGDGPGPGPDPRGVVVVIHGGFWKPAYDASLGEPLARDLAARGWAAWNIEYRRVGNGGGTPGTFEDVAAAIDLLAELDVPLGTVVTLGHSAGGHLAVWAAGRPRPRVRVTAAISQAGVLDLRAGAAAGLGDGAVRALLGEALDDAAWDPIRQLPLDVPVLCVHTEIDLDVPITQSRDYVERAVAAGAEATLVEVPGDHDAHLDVHSEAWSRTVEILEHL